MNADNYTIVRALPPQHGLPLYPEVHSLEAGPVFTHDEGYPKLFPVSSIAVVDPLRNRQRPFLAFDRFHGTLAITEQRTVFFTGDYDRGRSMGLGIGFLGLTIAVLSWLVGRSRARKRSQGLALIGQIMHEQVREITTGPDSLIITSTSPLSPRPLVTQLDFEGRADLAVACLALQQLTEAKDR